MRITKSAKFQQSRNKEVVNFDHMESAGFDFLISDLDLAMTLTHIATKSGKNAVKKSRNQRNARRAYDTVQALASRIALTGAHRKEFDRRLEKLRSELRKLGEEF